MTRVVDFEEITFESAGVLLASEGTIGATGASEPVQGFDGLDTLRVHVLARSRGVGERSLSVEIEHSDDGEEWESATSTLEFTEAGSRVVEIDDPKDYMRLSWESTGKWASLAARAAPALANTVGGGDGGGGSLPDWWEIDNTPGSEFVNFLGQVEITPPGDIQTALVIQAATAPGEQGGAAQLGNPFDSGWTHRLEGTDLADEILRIQDFDGNLVAVFGPGEQVAFNGAVTITPSDGDANPLLAGSLHVESQGTWVGKAGFDVTPFYVSDNVEAPTAPAFNVLDFDGARSYFQAGLAGIAWTGPVLGRFMDAADKLVLRDHAEQEIAELIDDGSWKLGPYATGVDPSRPVLTLYAVSGGQPGLVVHDTFNDVDVFAVGADGELGFFGATPAAQPATPTTLNELIAALQTLGLIA